DMRLLQFQDIERAGGVEDRQDGDKHQRRIGEGVEKELERRIDPFGAAPATNQQIHGDKAELEEDEEEHQIEGQKDPNHRRLQEQHQDHVEANLLVDIEVAEVDGNGHQQSGQQDEEEANAINTHNVVDANLGEPGMVLQKLHPAVAVVPIDQ